MPQFALAEWPQDLVELGEQVLGNRQFFETWLKLPAIELNGSRGIDLVNRENGK